MLRLSKLSDYGTVMMSYMAQRPSELCSVAAIAAAVGVTTPTASKVLKMLARGGLLSSRRGALGGYILSRPPANISLVQIIEAVEGPLGLTECGVATGLCRGEDICRIRARWQGISQALRSALGQITLVDMNRPVMPPIMNRPMVVKQRPRRIPETSNGQRDLQA